MFCPLILGTFDGGVARLTPKVGEVEYAGGIELQMGEINSKASKAV